MRSAWFTGAMLVTLVGCGRGPALQFVSSDDAGELAAPHQQQIADVLQQMFGTPETPTLRLPRPLVPDAPPAPAEVIEPDGTIEEQEPALDLVDALPAERMRKAAAAYNRRCAGCHGVTGNGSGEAAPYLHPKPRDYRKGVFKFTSTVYGAKPVRADLARTIRRGAKGTSMPNFPLLTDEEVELLVDYVVMLSQRGEIEDRLVRTVDQQGLDDDQPIKVSYQERAIKRVVQTWEEAKDKRVTPVSPRPPMTAESIKAGREIFTKENCYKCHGKDYRGQLEWLDPSFLAAMSDKDRESLNKDAWGHVAPAADITAGMLHGGRRPIDIYRRIYSGINGTPMPGFGQSFAAEPDKIWHLVHFVLNIVEGREPAPNAAADEEASS